MGVQRPHAGVEERIAGQAPAPGLQAVRIGGVRADAVVGAVEVLEAD
jgi:hypothetical protein